MCCGGADRVVDEWIFVVLLARGLIYRPISSVYVCNDGHPWFPWESRSPGLQTPEVAERWNSGMGPLNTAIASGGGLGAQVRQNNDGHRGMSRNSKPHLGQQFKQNSRSIKNFTICLIQNSTANTGWRHLLNVKPEGSLA